MEEEQNEEQEKNPVDILDILHSFDPSYHFRIRTLLSSISKNPDIITFDDTNHLIIDGVLLEGTNIVNCLKRFFNIKIPGTRALKGHKAFLSALHKIPLSKSLAPLLSRKPHTIRHPPGKKPHILRVYK